MINPDIFEFTGYINDINQEYTEVLMTTDSEGNYRGAYTYANGERISVEDLGQVEGVRNDPLYYLYDALGTTTAITNMNAGIIDNNRFAPFGEPLSPVAKNSRLTNSPWGYTGESHDIEAGLVYLRARYYEPETGRFIQQDSYPFFGEIEEPLTRNLYLYGNGNPLKNTDPSGNNATLALNTISTLAKALPWLIGGISTGLASVKAAIATSSIPVIAIAAVTVAVVSIVLVVNEAKKLEIEASKVRAWVDAQVKEGGVDEDNLRNHTVYVIINKDTKKVEYVGRTINYSNRQYKHQVWKDPKYGYAPRFPERKFTMMPIKTNMSLEDARALEQALITAFTLDTLKNTINSISPTKWEDFKYEFERVNNLTSSYFDD
jgi:RHS repeat-associated protein